MLTMSTVADRIFVIPRIALSILAASVFASFLSQVPASFPANVPAHAKNAKVVSNHTPVNSASHYLGSTR
jgi:hypothetical protein